MLYATVVNGYAFESSLCGPPSAPGVYIIWVINPRNKTKKAMYVGSSRNILNRLSNLAHPYRILFAKYTNLWVATESCVTDNYLELERDVIMHLNPPINKTYKMK